MAEVMSLPRQHDSQSYYSGSSLKRSAPSQSSFFVGSPTCSSSRSSATTTSQAEHHERMSRSLPSSTTASFSDFSQLPSFSSTPASSFSFGSKNDESDDEEIAFPSYDEVQFFHQDEPLDLPPSPRPESDDGRHEDEEEEDRSITDTTRSESPLPTPTVADDSAVKNEPSRHVDYLSHDWREEDIWSSWRHIVSRRKLYGQRSRLENASWRTWAKSKYHLATVSPETLNWLKESDVTWLYGPLQPAVKHPVTSHPFEPASQHANANAYIATKPILKKRSMSEVMLQRSLSTSSLLKQATASVQSQQTDSPPRPSMSRAISDYVPSLTTCSVSRDQVDYFSSRTSSGDDTPCDCPNSKRHIRFDDKVEQCIAVEGKDGDYDDEASDEEEDEQHGSESDSDSSEDGVVMMRRPRRKRAAARPKAVSRNSSASGRTIEKLPATTLKYRADSDATQQPPTPFARPAASTKLAPSPSSETLRPSHPSRNYLLADDDDEDVDEESSWQPTSTYANRRDSVSVAKARAEMGFGNHEFGNHEDGEEQGGALRRTGSGMFMPYEEDEDDIMAAQLGLLGKVSDTINTAKDIAHVIWNVGWRK